MMDLKPATPEEGARRRRMVVEYLRTVPAEQYDHSLWLYSEHDGEIELSGQTFADVFQ